MAKGTERLTQIDRGEMRRTLGVGDLFAIGYGDLGASIYYALGITAFYSLGATPISLLLAGFVFSCTASTYAEMSSVVAEAGGSASYSRKTFNDLISFIAGWALLLDYIVTIAISAYSIAPYLSIFFPFLTVITTKIALCVLMIGLLVSINLMGAKHSTRISLVLTILTLITQGIIIIIGAFAVVDIATFFNHLIIGGSDLSWSPTWDHFWKGTAMAMVAYTGIESMAQLSSEAKEPKKTVPKAIMIAMTTLLAMYFGLSFVALSAMTPQELSTTYLEDPLAGIVSSLPFGSSLLVPWVGLLAAVLLFVSANAGLIGASRLSFNMGEHFQLPRFFYKLSPKRKTPYVALCIFGFLASLIVIASGGNILFLADLYNFGAMLAFFCAHLSLICHRVMYPDIERPFKVKFNIRIKNYQIPITAIVGAIVTFAVWVLVVATKPDGRYLGIMWLILGLFMYVLFRRKFELSPTGSVEIEKIQLTKEHVQSIKPKNVLLLLRGINDPSDDEHAIAVTCNLCKESGADLTFLVIQKIPFMMSFAVQDTYRETMSFELLNRAQALALDFGIHAKLAMTRARATDLAILEMVESQKFDLVVVSTPKEGPTPVQHEFLQRLLQNTTGMVWIIKPPKEIQPN